MILNLQTRLMALGIVLLGVVASGGTGLVWGLHKGHELEAIKQEGYITQIKLRAEQDAAAARQSALDAEHAMQGKLKEAQDALSKEQASQRRVAADLQRTRLERDGLRDQVTAFAGGGQPADDSVTACRVRSEALGKLLVDGLRVQEDLASGAESASGDVRALLAAWPR